MYLWPCTPFVDQANLDFRDPLALSSGIKSVRYHTQLQSIRVFFVVVVSFGFFVCFGVFQDRFSV